MADLRKHSSTSNLIRFTLKNSSTGVGLTGLSSASSGLIISTICDIEAVATTYTVAGSTVETITTLGTFATPTATKCRFKEVDDKNHKGLYEFQFADARFSAASAKRLIISVTGATNLLDADYEIQLVSFDIYTAIAQTGDGYAVVTNGTYGLSAIENLVDGLETTIGAAGAGLTALGDTRIANLDAAVSSRMATYTQPTGFLAATFPSDPADQSLIIAATDAIKADTAAILFDTIEIGVAGSGLTAIPWNAAWDAEVQSECADALDDTYGDATGLTADGTKDRLRTMGWVLKNKMAVTNANGNTTIYKDNSTTPAFTVAGCLTDDSTTITRLRLA